VTLRPASRAARGLLAQAVKTLPRYVRPKKRASATNVMTATTAISTYCRWRLIAPAVKTPVSSWNWSGRSPQTVTSRAYRQNPTPIVMISDASGGVPRRPMQRPPTRPPSTVAAATARTSAAPCGRPRCRAPYVT
jgi:hypothetical protein